MNPTEFHEKLTFYSQADDPQDLAIKILGGPQKDITGDSFTAEKVSTAVKQFLFDNVRLLNESDLPALKDLDGLVHTLRTWTKGVLSEDKLSTLSTLEKTIATSFKFANSEFAIKVDSINPDSIFSLEDVLSISDKYSSLTDLTNLRILGKDVSSKALKKAAAKATANDITDFINQIHEKLYSDPLIFKEMIHTFFEYAPYKTQSRFFFHIRDENFLSDIISVLPSNLTDLNLRGCACLKDHHVEKIVDRLNSLQKLNLSHCGLLTDAAVRAVANNPNMINLQKLIFRGNRLLTDEAAFAIANSPNMANLQNLRFSATKLTDAAAVAIATSPHMNKLQSLNFAITSVGNLGVITIATNPNMSNMRKLSFSMCPITDAAVIAISTSENMSNLRYLKFILCKDLTDSAAISIASSPTLNQLKELFLNACRFTNLAATAFAESLNLPNLERLDFSWCPNLTNTAVQELIESINLPELKDLNFENCNQITLQMHEFLRTWKMERRAALSQE